MTAKGRQLAKLLARILITTGLLVWVFSQIDLGQFWQAVKMARWEFLIAVWGLTVVLFWIRSVKMQLILRRQGCNVNCSTIFGATTATALYSLIMPGMLSTGVKWYVLKKSTGKGSNVLSSMLYNQLSTMALMTVFGLAALMATNPTSLLIADSQNQWVLPVVCGALLAAVLLSAFLLLSKRVGGKVLEVLRFLLRPLPARIRQKSHELLDQIAIFQTVGWRFHLIVVLITTVGTLIGGVATYVLAARSANITVSVSVLTWLCVVVYVLGRLPISVANLGVRESLLVLLLSPYGVDKPAALLMSTILFSALVFMAGIGAIVQLVWASSGAASTAVSEQGKSVENFRA
jgi:uncharacterized membrane protein YbhN (UPF0104 family)